MLSSGRFPSGPEESLNEMFLSGVRKTSEGRPRMEDLRFFVGATIFLVVAMVIVTQAL